MDKIGLIIVDDHPLFREGVRNVLDAEEDLEVLAASRCQSAQHEWHAGYSPNIG